MDAARTSYPHLDDPIANQCPVLVTNRNVHNSSTNDCSGRNQILNRPHFCPAYQPNGRKIPTDAYEGNSTLISSDVNTFINSVQSCSGHGHCITDLCVMIIWKFVARRKCPLADLPPTLRLGPFFAYRFHDTPEINSYDIDAENSNICHCK